MRTPTLSVKDAQDIDARATKEYGIPSIVLMENAGRAVAEQVHDVLYKFPVTVQVAILCGTGKNGGDGFVAARYLHKRHENVRVVLMNEGARVKGDAGINQAIAEKIGVPAISFAQFMRETKRNLLNTPIVIVDAILGTGFKGPLTPALVDAVAQINHLKKYHNTKVTIVAVDVPTGVNADEGPTGDVAVHADLTITFVCRKKGLHLEASRPYAGRIEVADIGIPEKLLKEYA